MSHHTTGQFAGDVPDGTLDHIETHLQDYGLPLEREGTRLRMTYAAAEIVLNVTPEALHITITGQTLVQVHQVRESALYLLDHVFAAGAAGMVWADAVPDDGIPPNLHEARVVSVRRHGANFLRIEVECAATAGLTVGGMHFSLLLPPEGRTPVWPRIGPQNRTIWPEGADALHRAAYTFVTIDPDAGRFSFDVFVHDGGRMTAWAQALVPGDVMRIMGPGGGDFPPGQYLLMAGDETALPAMRRILEHSPADRRGEVLIEIADPKDVEDLHAPKGVSIRWIARAPGALAAALRVAGFPETGEDRYVWVAAEQRIVREARNHFRKAHGVARTEGYFSAYWVDG